MIVGFIDGKAQARPDRSLIGNGEQPIDVVRIGRVSANFETINGLPQGILTAALAVVAILIIRPIVRGVRAFIRG